MSVNIIGRYAIVKHCPEDCCAPASLLVDKLNEKRLGVAIQEANDDENQEVERVDKAKIAHTLLIFALFVIGVIVGFGSGHEKAANILFVLCCAIGCIPIIQAAYISYLRKTVDINVLMLVAVAGSSASEDYLDSSLVVALFLLTETIEDVVLCYVRNSIKLSSGVVPKKAVLLSGKSVTVESLNIGDIVTIRAGDMIPVDGVITRGQAVVDESALTGIKQYS